jgi:HlyD family secretion protein
MRGVIKWLVILLTIAGGITAAVWEGKRMYRAVAPEAAVKVPLTRVKRGDLTFTISARGELHGGNSEMLTAPLTGGGEMHITSLKKPGDVVKANEVVLEFDPTDQEYKLKEAESDVAESKLKVEQAQAQAEAESEEARYALQKAESDIRVAEYDVRKNPILPAITARQNDLALQAAKDRGNQLRQDLNNRQATNAAAIAVQQAALGKADIQATVARKNIEALNVKAHSDGYVSIRQNQQGNFMWGMTMPNYQVGDTVRGGMAVAEIPDLKNWEILATIPELDRGTLSKGQKVEVGVIALPGRTYTGSVSDLGGTGGPPWARKFQCTMKLDKPTPDLRPGMSVRIVISTDVMKEALWLPAQAVFESGSRTYVYVPAGASFIARDVHLVRRSESQVVLSDLPLDQQVALADPQEETRKKETGSRGPAIPK